MKLKKFKSFWLLLLVVFLLGYLAGGQGLNFVSAVTDKNYENLKLFSDVLYYIQKDYVEKTKVDQLVEGAIKGMLVTLDPHSSYMSPDVYREMQVETKGKFGGLGMEISIKDGILTVVAPIEDTPAYEAGLKPGDQIVKIEGESTKTLNIFEAVKKLRGKEGTKVTISIMREGFAKPKDFTLTRATIQMKSIKHKILNERIGYIRVIQFQQQTSEDFQEALSDIEKKVPRLQGLIIDLRNNPGGLLEEAVKISDEFLDSGMIVYTEGRLEAQRMEFQAKENGNKHDYPIIILVNAGTASGSEIVAGALQDHGRALILGTTTFGKGSVQTVIPLENEGGLRLTTAKYFTPKGRSIHSKGIEPDIIVEDYIEEEITSAKKRPVIREKDLEDFYRHFKPQDNSEKAPAETEEKTEEQEEANDPSLNRAVDLLKSWEIFKGTGDNIINKIDKG